jgi:hypothetical protein
MLQQEKFKGLISENCLFSPIPPLCSKNRQRNESVEQKLFTFVPRSKHV